MFAKKISRIIPKLINNNNNTTRYMSALYVTNDKASETFSVLTPHIDFEERLKNKQELETNIKLRQLNINLDEVIRLWNFYKHVESKKDTLEESKLSISRTITNLAKKGDKYGEKLDTLKAHGKMVKEDLRILKESFNSVEEKAVLQALSIPNLLHRQTPTSDVKIIHKFLEPKKKPQEMDHIKIGEKLQLIEYNNINNYYLKNDASRFELNSLFHASSELKNKKYIQFSNSDFARSVIIEGVGSDPNKTFTITDKNNEYNRLHLCGGASLASFMAFYCKHTIFQTQLPLRHFTIGRRYQPAQENTTKSLFNVAQETSLNVFVATKDTDELCTRQFEQTLQDVIDIYETMNYHFRVCYIPAKDLQLWESLRASVQMFSPFLNDYVEVANLSLCGSYISKRLLFNYGKGANVEYPGLVTGTVVSVPKLLACVLENEGSLISPKVFNMYI